MIASFAAVYLLPLGSGPLLSQQLQRSPRPPPSAPRPPPPAGGADAQPEALQQAGDGGALRQRRREGGASSPSHHCQGLQGLLLGGAHLPPPPPHQPHTTPCPCLPPLASFPPIAGGLAGAALLAPEDSAQEKRAQGARTPPPPPLLLLLAEMIPHQAATTRCRCPLRPPLSASPPQPPTPPHGMPLRMPPSHSQPSQHMHARMGLTSGLLYLPLLPFLPSRRPAPPPALLAAAPPQAASPLLAAPPLQRAASRARAGGAGSTRRTASTASCCSRRARLHTWLRLSSSTRHAQPTCCLPGLLRSSACVRRACLTAASAGVRAAGAEGAECWRGYGRWCTTRGRSRCGAGQPGHAWRPLPSHAAAAGGGPMQGAA
jgi:hypothetical protein